MKIYPYNNALAGCFLTVMALINLGDAEAQRSRREYISINTDVYEISIQRDGAAGINATDGFPVFRGAQARVRYAGEDRFRRLNTDATLSARFQVNDRLGQGQGLVFNTPACEWHLRAYPGKPYFGVRLIYKNTGKSPVTVAALSPWFISPETKGTASVGGEMSDTRLLCADDKGLQVHRGASQSQNMIVMRNPLSRRMIVAGFLTNHRAETYLTVEEDSRSNANGFGRFEAVCVFDPPVVVPPGATLEAEELYISVGNVDVAGGMERYGVAVAAALGLQAKRPPIGSGLDSSAIANAQQLTDALSWQRKHLWNWHWRQFTIGVGWETNTGDWQPAPDRFPDGFAPLVATAREAGIDMGIRLRPFLAAADSTLAMTHPEWLLPYDRDSDMFVLNVASEQVREWLTQLARTLTAAYGFQTVILEDADCLLHCELPDSSGLTRTQFYILGLQAIRAGIGNNNVLSVTPWHPAALPLADAIGIGIHGATDAYWTSVLEMDAALSLQTHLYPTGVAPDAGVLYFTGGDGSKATGAPEVLSVGREQSIAWLTAAALSGAPIRLGNPPQTLGDADIALLGKFSPPLPRPAYTVDMDDAGTASIRHLPMKAKAGEWHLVAFFNWSRLAPTVMPLDTGNLGLDPDSPYTLYEFFPGVYHGLVKNATSIAVPAASVRLFGLRPYAGHPMLIASDRHLSQGALDHERIEWDEGNKRLTGKFRADPVPYCLRVLVPPPWRVREAHASVDNFESGHANDDVIELFITPDTRQTVTWHVELDQTP